MQNLRSALKKYVNDRRFVINHLMAWLIVYGAFVSITLLLEKSEDVHVSTFTQLALLVLVLMVIFYIHFLVCELFFSRKILFFSVVLFVFLCFLSVECLVEINRTDERPSLFFLLFLASVYYFLLISIATMSWVLKTSATNKKMHDEAQRDLEKANSELMQKNLLLQNQVLISENNFLRAQINPHFLHNTLSYFYSKSLNGHSEELSEAILTLSDIMRYALEKRNDSHEMVLLEDEVVHIQNVIKLNRMRFSDSLQINFDIYGNIRGVYLIPLVLVTLVENAFKHGELTDASHPVNVHLTVSEKEDELIFSVQNKVKKGPVELSHGIGMENTRQRLRMAYESNYQLDLKEENGFYTATLVIKLKNEKMESITDETISNAQTVNS